MKNAGFCIFFDWIETLDFLDEADAYKVIKALSRYYTEGVNPVEIVPNNIKATVNLMFQQIKRAEKVSEERAKAGRASAEARSVEVCSNNVEQKSTPVEQKSTTNTNTNTNTETNTIITSSNEEDKAKRKRFVAPTIDEVRDYCNENGYRIDAEAFVDHYQSVGWKVGNKPMRDWKAAVRTWVRRDKERMPKKQTESSFDDTFMLTALKRVYGEAGA